MTSYSNWNWYDIPFDPTNINTDKSNRFTWTNNGLNPQTCTLNATLHERNFPAGVYKVSFFANDGIADGISSSIYYAIDNPAKNDRPYIKEIPEISLQENDVTILDLDKYGFDPDRNTDTIGMVTYSILSITGEFSRAKLCGQNKLTNNSKNILTLSPLTGDARGESSRKINITIRATDGGTPALSFDRTISLNILKQERGSLTTNPTNLPNCFINPPVELEPDIVLEPDLNSAPIATVTSLPQSFNPLALNIPNFTTSFKQNSLEETLSRTLKKDSLINTLISGGMAFIGLKLNPTVNLNPVDLKKINFLLSTTVDNKATRTNINGKVVSFDSTTRELLLEVTVPGATVPGEGTLVLSLINQNKKELIARSKVLITPSLNVKSIKSNMILNNPIISLVKLLEVPETVALDKSGKKHYLLIVKGNNFTGNKFTIDKTKINSPIGNQPFTVLSFVEKDGITIKTMKVSKTGKRLTVLLEREQNDTSNIRHFTLSTLAGQDTAQVNMNFVLERKKSTKRN